MVVLLGEVPSRECRETKRIIQHPQYNVDTENNDYALLELESPVRITRWVRTIRLPPRFFRESTFAGRLCWVTGWGATSVEVDEDTDETTETFPTILQQAAVNVFRRRQCVNAYAGGDRPITRNMVCTKRGHQDTCSGDSGGPLACRPGRNWYVWGITSWGPFDCSGNPGVYAFVRFKAPIEEKLPTSRIIGGQDSSVGRWPWQVAVKEENAGPGRGSFCGGTLISPKWVLTAAHCFKTRTTASVVLGEVDFRILEPSEQRRNVEEIHKHPLYNPDVSQDYDYALLELEEAVVITRNVRPICLPRARRFRDTTFDGKTCTITGWGAVDVTPPDSPDGEPTIEGTPTLQEAEVEVITREQCSQSWNLSPRMVCAGPTRDVGTCFGDSGGPLQCRDGRIWYLWGVTSFGSEFCREKPGVFASLKNSGENRNEILSWIDEEINGSGPVLPGK
ncbi:chymotrypsinogen A-like [Clytia hemisphaerica]|uniref:chymotrypsinogen A-like n=1 Tax=Clytia hemisphaerica TaxID=252671 RepID=UPI0034D65F28